MGQQRPPIVFYAFDLLQLNGKDLRKLPVEDRKAQLEARLKKSCSSSLSLSLSESFPANIRAPLLRFAPSVLSSCGSLTPTVEIMAQPPHV